MGILDHLRRRRTFQQLYEHWLDTDAPVETTREEWRESEAEALGAPNKDTSQTGRPPHGRTPKMARPREKDSVQLRLVIRYVFMGVGLVGLLLVALSVVSTVLVMRSCS